MTGERPFFFFSFFFSGFFFSLLHNLFSTKLRNTSMVGSSVFCFSCMTICGDDSGSIRVPRLSELSAVCRLHLYIPGPNHYPSIGPSVYWTFTRCSRKISCFCQGERMCLRTYFLYTQTYLMYVGMYVMYVHTICFSLCLSLCRSLSLSVSRSLPLSYFP